MIMRGETVVTGMTAETIETVEIIEMIDTITLPTYHNIHTLYYYHVTNNEPYTITVLWITYLQIDNSSRLLPNKSDISKVCIHFIGLFKCLHNYANNYNYRLRVANHLSFFMKNYL